MRTYIGKLPLACGALGGVYDNLPDGEMPTET
jgi:hypothetical protein